MDDGQMPLLPKRLKYRHSRMQSKESVEVNHRATRNVDRRPHGVICRLAVWNHNIQTIRSAPLEDDYQPLVSHRGLSRRVSRACKKSRDRRRPHDSECTVAKKYSASDGHKTSAFSPQLSAVS